MDKFNIGNLSSITSKWYQRPPMIILFLFIIPPIGIFLLWKEQGRWKKNTKIVLTVVSAIMAIGWISFLLPQPTQITDLTLTADDPIVLEVSETQNLKPSILPKDAESHLVKYISDNDSVASYVSGIVMGISEGETDIYVSDTDGKVQSNKIHIVIIPLGDKENIREAEEIIDLINSIGTVSLDSKEAIEIARNQYDNSSERVQHFVTNVDLLISAEKKYDELTVEYNKSKAKEIEELITDIGSVSLNSKDAIVAARSKYDSAPDEIKEFVDNYEDLTNAESTYQTLKQNEETKKTSSKSSSGSNNSVSSDNSSKDNSKPKSRTVYVTKSGKRYHYDNQCNGGTYYESTLSDAKARGLTPCKKCIG